MHIVKKNSKFKIVGFGAATIEQQLDIINCFVGQDDIILFQHTDTKLEQLDNELRKELMRSAFEGYCSGIYQHRYIDTKYKVDNDVKEILYNAVAKGATETREGLTEEEYKNKLFQELISGKLNYVDNSTLERIKEVVFLSYWNEKNVDEEALIKSRTMFVNNYIGITEDTSYRDKGFQVAWYILYDRSEIKKVIDNTGSFTCVVLKKGDPFENFIYVITLIEGPETHDLLTEEKQKGHFEINVLPRLKQVVPNIAVVNY